MHGDLDTLAGRFASVGLEVTEVRTVLGTARWASIDQMVQIEVESTPLVDRISDDVYRRIREESREILDRYRTETGAEVPLAAHLVVARKPATA
ncbi:MAG TPA: hypothetical protein VGJ95_23970 [Pseudonocardiaceae bacterium]